MFFMIKIAFVCTGNTCRSPMAAALFNMEAKALNIDAEAVSCGIFPSGGGATSEAIIAMKLYALDITAHISRGITPDIFEECHEVYPITQAHRDILTSLFPQYTEKIKKLDTDVADPFGYSADRYIEAAETIHSLVRGIINKYKNG